MVHLSERGNLVEQSDTFHLSKHIMKHVAYAHEYHINFDPINSSS